MGLPTTLGGITSFIIFIVLIVGMSAPDLYPDQTARIENNQKTFQDQFNFTTNTTADPGIVHQLFGLVGLDGIYSFIIGFFSILVSSFIFAFDELLMFVGIFGTLPSEFFIVIALVSSALIISLVKLIFLSGD